MGKIYEKCLTGNRFYCCSRCGFHLAYHNDIESKNFRGSHGKAYLFVNAVNITAGPSEERILLTGLHVVADIYCNNCHSLLGWKYLDAQDEKQKYKIGKYILERAKIRKDSNWDEG